MAYKKEKDLVTSADIAVQKLCLKLIKENFPHAGIVAEEKFSCKCTDSDNDYYFVLDPLDGTKAYGRRQSHSIASMVAFVFEGEICGVAVADVMSREVYYSRPDSDKVHRISDYSIVEELRINPRKHLRQQHIQLRKDPRDHSEFIQIATRSRKGLFKGVEVTGGSIGSMFARLWKGEVGAVVLEPGIEMPWDITPVMGLSERLGFVLLMQKDYGYKKVAFSPSKKSQRFAGETLIIHESRVDEFIDYFQRL